MKTGKLEVKLSLFNVLREMQIKTTTTYPLERLKKRKKKKNDNIKVLVGM